MKKLRRLLFRFFLFSFFIIVGILVLNTLRFTTRQISAGPVESITVDTNAAQRLARAVQFPTASYEDHIDTLAFRQLIQYIDSVYAPVNARLDHYRVNDFSLVYRWPGKNSNLKPVLLMGHLDVVPVEGQSLNHWEVPPFSGKIKDGFIWGRGTLDDKLNPFGIFEAIQLLLQKDYQPERTLFLAFGHDEEVGGKNGAEAIARRLQQQGIEFEYVLDEGMIILENALPGLTAPVALIGTAEKGYATLTLRVNLNDGGHSSMPPPQTAIGILSAAVTKLETNPFPARIDGPTKDLFAYVGPEMNLPFNMIFANQWLFGGMLKKQLSKKVTSNATVRTTVAPTIISGGIKDNVLPSAAEAKVNFRILPGETVATVLQRVKKVINDERVEVLDKSPRFSAEPSKISGTDTFGFSVLQKTVRQIFPETVLAPALVIAATDSRHYDALTDDIYRFLPVQLQNSDLSRIHGFNERISVQNYEHLIQFYYQLILNSCN